MIDHAVQRHRGRSFHPPLHLGWSRVEAEVDRLELGLVPDPVSGGGTDSVEASVSHTLSDGVENLTLTGVGSIDGTGNSLDNVIIGNAGAEVAGLVISLDREEVGKASKSAVQELEQTLGIPVVSIIKLSDLIEMLEESREYEEYLQPITNYRTTYGI